MSDVASLELCKELYELSVWGNEDGGLKVAFSWYGSEDSMSLVHTLAALGGGYSVRIPAYDSGYLLRKLPPYLGTQDDDWLLRLMPSYLGETWSIGYAGLADTRFLHAQQAATPEDTLCLLTIELFKQGILKHE